MKLTTWISLSAQQMRVSKSAVRMALYRGRIPRPECSKLNQRVIEVLEPPLQSAADAGAWTPRRSKSPKSTASLCIGSIAAAKATGGCSALIS
jgi:hypothetical protein